MKKTSLILIGLLLAITSNAAFIVQKKTIINFGGDCFYWIHEYEYSGTGVNGDWGVATRIDLLTEPGGIKTPCGRVINFENTDPENLPADIADVQFNWVLTNGIVTDVSFTIVNDYTADGSALTYLNERKQMFIDVMNNNVLYIHPSNTIFIE